MKYNHEKKPNVSIYLDKRRIKKNGKYPLKLRVYYMNDERRLYPLSLECTEEEYKKAYMTPKPRPEYKPLHVKLKTIEGAAIEVIDQLPAFSFDLFKKKFFRDKTESNNVLFHFNEYIRQLASDGKINTRDNYAQSLKSITTFAKEYQGSEIPHLPFEIITVDFLKKYEKWMLGNNNSRTTVGIYLRPLRAIFNIAIESKEISEELYPFGKRKYQIPGGNKVKKSLDKDVLSTLYYYPVEEGGHKEKARDFFFLSYQCNGMNVADICRLKNKDIDGNILNFLRKKTLSTSKENSKPIIVALTDDAMRIIEKYRNKDRLPDKYVFSVLLSEMSEVEKARSIKSFTRYINQHIKELAMQAGVTTKLSTNWGRHSFTTNAIRGGAKMEYIQDSLGHQNMKTTMNYWSGFEDNAKHDVTAKLMDFKKYVKEDEK